MTTRDHHLAGDDAGPERRRRALELFETACDLAPDARAAWLAQACAGDLALRQRVEAMLAADAGGQQAFSGNAADWLHNRDDDADTAATFTPRRIGPWRLLSVLGHGGMGAVFRAERADGAYAQQAALKLIRFELDTPAARERFLQERQILASLRHPSIARLLDGGFDEHGAPYFAMELVEGQRIDAWCAAQRLDVRARVRLFQQVVEAVGEAHRNLVVHRDLKPSNVLVDADGRAKLLDFGIAKLTQDAGVTVTGERAMTPEYAAPEQVQGGPVTTATDVYQLGVLLYGLLAGAHPLGLDSGARLHLGRQMAALARPPLPLSRAALQAGEAAAAERGATAKGLGRQLSGDLEAIAGCCLEPDPARRYPSADALLSDLRAWLDGRPVNARLPTAGYRLRRFVGRNQLAVGAGAALLLALLAGLVGTAWQARRAAAERDQVLAEMRRTESIKNYLMLMFRDAGEAQGEQAVTAKQVLDRSAKNLALQYRGKPREHADTVEALGSLYPYMNDSEGAIPLLRDYLQHHASDALPEQRADIGAQLSEAELLGGNPAEARKRLDDAQAFWNRDADRYRRQLIASRKLQSQVEKEESGPARAIVTLEQALREHDAYFGRDNPETANILNSLAIAYQANGQIDQADRAFADCWKVYEAIGATNASGALLSLGNWATVAYRKQDYPRAISLLKRATALRRELYGPSAALAAMQGNLGKIVMISKRPEEALAHLQPALAMARQFTGDNSPLTINTQLTVAEAQLQLRRFDQASATLRQTYAALHAGMGERSVFYALGSGIEARLYDAQGRRAEARALADRMVRVLTELGEAGAPYLAEARKLQATLLERA